jgi:hypothetical protein
VVASSQPPGRSHPMSGEGELPGDGDAATAADVQDVPAPGETVQQIGHPTVVRLGCVVVGAVVARQGVVAAPGKVNSTRLTSPG